MDDYFKTKYQNTWGAALTRQNYSITWTKQNLPSDIVVDVSASVIGKGADSTAWVDDSGFEKNAPDYVLKRKTNQEHLANVEVTRYWSGYNTMMVRPDKIGYALSHPDTPYWVILVNDHSNPMGIRFIQPDPFADYPVVQTPIRGSNEGMVHFKLSDPEVKTSKEFLDFIGKKFEDGN